VVIRCQWLSAPRANAFVDQSLAITLTAQVPDTVCVGSPCSHRAKPNGGTAPLLDHRSGVGLAITLHHRVPTSQ
jgi:hypothetical protein